MLVGITSYLKKVVKGYACGLRFDYINAILSVAKYLNIDIVPIIIPTNCDHNIAKLYAKKIDALIISGNTYDILPKLYNSDVKFPSVKICDVLSEKRTLFELELYKYFIETKKPFLGICGGLQLMNVFHNGTLFQDINSEIKTNINHKSTFDTIEHSININLNTKLYKIINQKVIHTNSMHHQSVKKLGDNLVISAYSDDNVVEAIELQDHPFAIGLQWHPEYLLSQHEFKIFSEFINNAYTKFQHNTTN